MKKMLGIGFWELIARFILRNRLAIIISIILITIFLALQWKNIRFTHSEANLIPADDKVNVDYNAFLKTLEGLKCNVSLTKTLKFMLSRHRCQDIYLFQDIYYFLVLLGRVSKRAFYGKLSKSFGI